MKPDYRSWLIAQGYGENTCSTQMAHIRQIERYYGDLAPRIAAGELEQLVAEFSYSKDDERHNRANPCKVEFSGRTYTRLQSLKGALRRYARFLGADLDELDTDGADPSPLTPAATPAATPNDMSNSTDRQRFTLERDMQSALRADITALDPTLTIIDDGAEHSVASGFVDILCEDDQGCTVVIELKAGKTDARVVGQILGYMGDLIGEGDAEAVRGIIVAHAFDKRTRSAAKAIPNLTLATYAIQFSFQAAS